MARGTIHWILDVGLFLAFLALLLTGLLMAFTLPPGSGGATVWGWTRHEWGDLHFWIALAALTLVATHLALHWNWVHIVTRKLFTRAAGPGTHCTIFQNESLRVILPSSNSRRSTPRTSMRCPEVDVPVSVHSETPKSPHAQWRSSP